MSKKFQVMKRQRSFLDEAQNPSPWKRRTLLMSSRSLPPLNATQKKQVARAIRNAEEVKWLDTAVAAAGVDITGTTTVLTAAAQGDDFNERVGLKIKLQDVDVRFFAGTGDSTNELRVIIWQYFENSVLQTPAKAIILENGASGAVAEVNSQYQLPRGKNSYRILRDHVFNLSVEGNPNDYKHFKIPINTHREVNFNESATTGYNHLCLTVLSDSGAATHPSVTWTCRVRYSDA